MKPPRSNPSCSLHAVGQTLQTRPSQESDVSPRGAAIICLLAALVLPGCATAPPQSLVVGKAEPVRVEVPVLVPCIDPAQIEPLPPSAMPPRTAGVAELASGAAADAVRYRELARKQAEMLKACATKGEPK
jgi:hypothetical protein